MKKIFLIILVVAVVGVAALFLIKGKAVVRKSKEIISEVKEAAVKKYVLTFQLAQNGISIARDDAASVLQTEQLVEFELEKGMHHFTFTKAGYEKLTKEIDVTEDASISIKLTKIVVVEHVPLPGFVQINSIPEGAAVLINNKQKGITPVKLELDAGDYSINLKLKNYHDFSQEFSLDEDETMSFKTVELLPKFAYYSVNATPPDAKIYLDDILVGSAPVSKTALSSGSHNLVVKYDMYYDYNQNFKVEDGEYKEFDIKLNATFGSLIIQSEPEDGANIYIDEQLVGKTPYYDGVVTPGQYRIRVEKEMCVGAE
ncbi:PEGA domain-containing protein, partial [Candidatus Cloacimonadota bacterium]